MIVNLYNVFNTKSGRYVMENFTERQINDRFHVNISAKQYAARKLKLKGIYLIQYSGQEDMLVPKKTGARSSRSKSHKDVRTDKDISFKSEWNEIRRRFKNVKWVKNNGKKLKLGGTKNGEQRDAV